MRAPRKRNRARNRDRHGIEAVGGQAIEAQQLADHVAIDGKRGPGERADPQRHLRSGRRAQQLEVAANMAPQAQR